MTWAEPRSRSEGLSSDLHAAADLFKHLRNNVSHLTSEDRHESDDDDEGQPDLIDEE